ncbi:MAG: hypothetical protein D3924_17245 [Candidatus Electrothrix sp. AR4]|nr:hypothetical protein [Candidatus Electrothrix sp. AR4]
MVKNIIYIFIAALIGIPSWQIGSIIMTKKKTTYMIQEQANKIKKYDNENIIKGNLKTNLELMGLPTDFTFEKLERRKVKIGYTYHGAATIFGYTYYKTSEVIEAVTVEGSF